jgi:hypothetical protein
MKIMWQLTGNNIHNQMNGLANAAIAAQQGAAVGDAVSGIDKIDPEPSLNEVGTLRGTFDKLRKANDIYNELLKKFESDDRDYILKSTTIYGNALASTQYNDNNDHSKGSNTGFGKNKMLRTIFDDSKKEIGIEYLSEKGKVALLIHEAIHAFLQVDDKDIIESNAHNSPVWVDQYDYMYKGLKEANDDFDWGLTDEQIEGFALHSLRFSKENAIMKSFIMKKAGVKKLKRKRQIKKFNEAQKSYDEEMHNLEFDTIKY